MKLRVILTVCATALAALAVGGAGHATASSAAPATECVATGTTTLSVGIGLPTSPKSGVGFSISGTCLDNGQTITASGTLSTASCGNSAGSGTIKIGSISRSFSIQTAGGTFVVTGPGVAGAGQVVADPTVSPNSCLDGSARFFRTTGVVNFA